MRHICAKCNRKRDEKYMEQSPILSYHYCSRSVIGHDFKPSCFDKHISEQIIIKIRELEKLKKSVRHDILPPVKKSAPVDKNKQITLTESIKEITQDGL